MTISTEFIIYVALYRLTVLTVGALSFYLGFRLFTRPCDGQHPERERSSTGEKAWQLQLTMANFWLGSFFVLFGTGLIGVMLWQGAPQLTLEDIKGGAGKRAAVKTSGGEQGGLTLLPEPCSQGQLSTDVQERLGQEWAKLKTPGMTLAAASVHFHHIARICQDEGRVGEALAMARLAHQVGPETDRKVHLALVTELLEANGEVQKAAEAHKELVEMSHGAEAPENWGTD